MRPAALFLVCLLVAGCAQVEDTAANETPAGRPNESVSANATHQEPVDVDIGAESGAIDENASESDGYAPNPLVQSVLSSYNESDPSSFSNVNILLDSKPDDVLMLLQSDDGYAVWTGLYVLSNIAHNATLEEKTAIKDALAPFIAGNASGHRFMAAATLVSMGDKSGLPVLISLLDDDSLLPLSEPASPVCDYSNRMLVRYSGEDFGFGCGIGYADHGAKAEWESWWEGRGQALEWDDKRAVFS